MEFMFGLIVAYVIMTFVFASMPKPKVLTNHYVCSVDDCDFEFASTSDRLVEFTMKEHEEYHSFAMCSNVLKCCT